MRTKFWHGLLSVVVTVLLITNAQLTSTALRNQQVSLLETVIAFGVGTSVAYKMYHYRGKARSIV